MLEPEYEAWLVREGYQQSTINSALASTRAAERSFSQKTEWSAKVDSLASAYGPLLKRYSRFLHEVPSHRWSLFDRFVADHFEAARAGAVLGSSTKEPLTRAQWKKLASRISEGEERADKALVFILNVTSLEPNAVLQLPLSQLATHLESQLREVLRPLQRKEHKTLAEYVSGSARGAYVNVHKRLRQIGLELGFEVDFHSIARTPAAVRVSTKVT